MLACKISGRSRFAITPWSKTTAWQAPGCGNAGILKAAVFAFTLFAIFEQSANCETERPIVAGYLRNAIAPPGDEPGIGVGGARRRDDPGNSRRWDALRSQSRWQSGEELPERRLRRETEIDRLRQTRRGVLNIEAGADREPIPAPRDGRLDIDRGELGAERGITPHPVRLVIGFQSEGREDPDARGNVAVAAVPDQRLRDIQIPDDVIDACVAAIAA